MRRFALFAALAAAPLAAYACSTREPPTSRPPATSSGQGGGSLFDAGLAGGPPGLDAAGLCGNELHQVVHDAPALYFVLDRSGSMSVIESGTQNRFDLVRKAMLDIVKQLGALVRVGAAVFPGPDVSDDSCAAGEEVFAVAAGDPLNGGIEGPTTTALRFATKGTPNGGTPTSPTLEALLPTLSSIPGKVIVLLATDGAPNCNPDALCGPDECQAYLDGFCDPGVNCCAPGGTAGPELCVDRAATAGAIGAIHAAGIDVYVIGIPGSALYADVLDDMAVAGGTANATSPMYQRVDDIDALGATFGAIAGGAISCEFVLEDPPAEAGMTNVYLDGVVLPYDPAHGWTWLGDATVWLHGHACDALKTGAVANVQVVTGCPTEKPN